MTVKQWLQGLPHGGLTEVAKVCQIHQNSVARWKSGKSFPSAQNYATVVSLSKGQVTSVGK